LLKSLDYLKFKILLKFKTLNLKSRWSTPALWQQRIAPQGSQRTPPTCIAATTPELAFGILNSVF